MRVLLLSLALHFAFFFVLPKGHAVQRLDARNDMEIELLVLESTPTITSSPRHSDAHEPHPSIDPRRTTPEHQPPAAETLPETEMQLPSVETTSPQTNLHIPSVLIDPSRVAASMVFGQEQMPAAGSHGNARETVGPSIEETLRRLEGEMHSEAVTKTYTQRTRAALRRRGDGSYAYQGHAFTATITPDGEVRFSDRGGVEVDPAAGSARFDLSDALMRANGQDPYAAERQWFMDQTEDLRVGLEDAALARRRSEGLRRIRGRLSALWNRTETPASERKRQIFAVWAEMAEGEEGAAGRREVLEWIAESLPRGDLDAYTASELAMLNRGRILRFSPYP